MNIYENYKIDFTGGTMAHKNKCICGDINARNCPEHQSEKLEWWIHHLVRNTCLTEVLDFSPEDAESYIHVIEYPAYQELLDENEILRSKQSQHESTMKATIEARDKYKAALEKCKEMIKSNIEANYFNMNKDYLAKEQVALAMEELDKILEGESEMKAP